MSTILVTGATGFIGRRLVPLLLGEGETVRVLVRDPSRLVADVRSRVEVVTGDLQDVEAVARAAAGVGTVLHLAALATACTRDAEAYRRCNADALVPLLTAARYGGARVVHVSSVTAVPPATPARARGLPHRPTPYAASKAAAEALVLRHVADGGDAVIVRPTRVYGPGPWNDANGATRLVAMYLRGRLRVRLRDGDVLANYVHVDDVARGILLAARRGQRGAAYPLGGENASLRGFLDAVAEVTGVRRTVMAVPPQVVLPAAALGALWGRLGGRASLTPTWLNCFLEDRRTDITATRATLGYEPLDLREGLRRTVAWLRTQEKGPWHVPVELCG